ncbi:gem-associated protein 2-like isoform X2 [Pararge aegeria]|uniref:gem-associated protein 2-like isoform X2 n=1 Tax=Pararge aegeria TaxID=116150 RepID=UPI0019D28722|nr:gem-associated protein 2-like isoform X2 [Pararge aegeria]
MVHQYNMSTKKLVYKIKRDDEDSETLKSTCFQISPDVELKDVPTNGEEYLLKVKKERERYSSILKCNKDYSIFAPNQSQFVEELSHAKAPDNLKPTIEWQNIQVADFSEVRMYISRLLNKRSAWPPNTRRLDSSLCDQNGKNAAIWLKMFRTEESSLSCVIGIHQAFIDIALQVMTDIILDDVKPGGTITHKTGQWIYALLACTRQPLVSDTVSILRDLARKCAKIRSNLNTEDENSKHAAAPLNLFICLVSRYFRQYDLAD